MSRSISVRLDENVRRVLEGDARERGVDLATYLRDLATERARAVRKAQIRADSRRVGELSRTDERAREFYEFWGSPPKCGKRRLDR